MRLAVLFGACLTLAACSGSRQGDRSPPPAAPATAAAETASGPRRAPVQIQMQNVRLHLDEGIVLDVRSLRGEMVSQVDGPPVFDDSRSYVLRVAAAEISMDMASLSALMNRHVFAYDGAPLSDITLRATRDGRLEQKATLHKGLPVPVSLIASIAPTPDGRLRLHVESMKAAGVPAKGLMDLFGLKVESLVDLKQRRGIEIDGNDIILTPGQTLPPPAMQGRISRAEIQGDRLVQTMVPERGQTATPLSPPEPRANHVYFFGSDIRFGKLTMHGADLQLIDADPRDPFDFYPARYRDQLIAGYSKNLPNGGLKTFMPDFSDLRPTQNRR